MRGRRTSFSAISSNLISYLTGREMLNQTQIAAVLDVDKSFISRVASKQREFSPTQMQAIADAIKVPLGVLMLEANRPKKPLTGELKTIADLCEQLILKCDVAAEEVDEYKRSRLAAASSR